MNNATRDIVAMTSYGNGNAISVEILYFGARIDRQGLLMDAATNVGMVLQCPLPTVMQVILLRHKKKGAIGKQFPVASSFLHGRAVSLLRTPSCSVTCSNAFYRLHIFYINTTEKK